MNTIKTIFTRVVWWGYAKAPQTLTLALGHLSRAGFVFKKNKMQTKSIKAYTLELLKEAGLKTDHLHNAPQVEIYYQLKEQIHERFKHEATSEPFFKLIDDLLGAVLKVAMQRHFGEVESKEAPNTLYLNGRTINPLEYIGEGRNAIDWLDEVYMLKWNFYALEQHLKTKDSAEVDNEVTVFDVLADCRKRLERLPYQEMNLIYRIEYLIRENKVG